MNRPELPALESVASNDRSALPLLICYFSMFIPVGAGVIWTFARYSDYLNMYAKLMSGILLLLLGYILIRVLSGYNYFKTDSKGIVLKGIFRKRFVPWIEIEEAYTKEATSDTILVLRTSNATYSTTPSGFSGGRALGDLIIASARQHLGRLGKADNISISGTALSFWDTIPECVPNQMDWTKPGSKAELILFVLVMAICLGIPGYLWTTAPGEKIGTFIMLVWMTAIMLMLMFCLLLPSLLRKATQVTLRDDYLEAKLPLKRIRLLWAEVTSAKWDQEGLVIFGGQPKREIRIPWDRKSDDSANLILSLIRRLRTAGVPQAVYIPDALRFFAKPEVTAVNTEAELRMSKPEITLIRWGIAGFGAFIAISAMFGPRHQPIVCGIAGAITIAWLFVAGNICNSYYIKVDSESLTRGFLGFKTIIRWQDVAKVQPRVAHGGYYLRNAKGKTVAEVSSGFGTPADRDKFNAALRSRLDHVDETQGKPWLARPWPGE